MSAPMRPLLRLPARALPRGFHTTPALAFATTLSRTSRLNAAVPDIPFLPRFLQPTTYVPAWSRHRRNRDGTLKPVVNKPWNPMTFFIWIFLLIGSQAIQFITLRHEHADFKRKADVKLDQLRDIVKRLQKGEVVDVAAELKVGDERSEKDWEEVLQEIEKGNLEFEAKKSEERKRLAAEDAAEGERREREDGERAERERMARERKLEEKDYMM